MTSLADRLKGQGEVTQMLTAIEDQSPKISEEDPPVNSGQKSVMERLKDLETVVSQLPKKRTGASGASPDKRSEEGQPLFSEEQANALLGSMDDSYVTESMLKGLQDQVTALANRVGGSEPASKGTRSEDSSLDGERDLSLIHI